MGTLGSGGGACTGAKGGSDVGPGIEGRFDSVGKLGLDGTGGTGGAGGSGGALGNSGSSGMGGMSGALGAGMCEGVLPARAIVASVVWDVMDTLLGPTAALTSAGSVFTVAHA